MLKKFIQITGRIVLSLIALLLFVWIVIQTTFVQNWIVSKVTMRLSQELHTEVKIKHVSFWLFNSMNLEGTLIKDLNKDTLLYADQVKVRITDWFFLKDELVFRYVGLEDAYVNLYRKDSSWNYQFLINYFSSAKPKKEKKSNLKFDLKKLDFKNVAFVKKDLWVGSLMEAKLGNMKLEAEDFNIDENSIDIKQLDLVKPYFSLTNLKGLRPPVVKDKNPKADTGMYFNEGDLQVTIGKLSIINGTFKNVKSTASAPYPYFDALHILLDKINGSVSNLSFTKDTLKANLDLAAKERSGFDIRKLKADFKLTPQIMEFSKLELVTPTSHLQNYVALKFKDFNKDFSNFVKKVSMDVRLRNAEIDSYDLAYFAPAAKTWNKRISVSGYGKGTL
ncbi:MAG TPA: hypothetical protein VF540_12225, partial [Segetibacter sp.]